MLRLLLLALYVFLAYHALRALLRWLLDKPPTEGAMVRDPECGVYILKAGAVTRRIRGQTRYFCGKDCAAAHAAKNQG